MYQSILNKLNSDWLTLRNTRNPAFTPTTHRCRTPALVLSERFFCTGRLPAALFSSGCITFTTSYEFVPGIISRPKHSASARRIHCVTGSVQRTSPARETPSVRIIKMMRLTWSNTFRS